MDTLNHTLAVAISPLRVTARHIAFASAAVMQVGSLPVAISTVLRSSELLESNRSLLRLLASIEAENSELQERLDVHAYPPAVEDVRRELVNTLDRIASYSSVNAEDRALLQTIHHSLLAAAMQAAYTQSDERSTLHRQAQQKDKATIASLKQDVQKLVEEHKSAIAQMRHEHDTKLSKTEAEMEAAREYCAMSFKEHLRHSLAQAGISRTQHKRS